MRLRAGWIGSTNTWKAFLSQEGFPGEELRSPDQLIVGDISVALMIGKRDARWSESLRAYVEKGGAAIVGQETLARWLGGRERWERFSYLVPFDRSLFRENWLIEMPGRGLVSEDTGVLLTEKGHRVLPIVRMGEGVAAAFPTRLDRCIKDTGSSRRLFHSPDGRFPSERVSRVPRGELRMLFHSVMRVLHHLRGLRYVHLASSPGDSAGVLGLRIDTDYSARREVEALYALLRGASMPASWFLHARSHIGWLRDFKAMEHQEIGLHCYAHKVYGRTGLNREMIEKGRNMLRGAGLDPRGFAAPYGIWSRGLPGDLESLGFLYSSEFGYDYDNTPSFPWTGRQFSGLLHVPVHPITIGSLVRERFDEAAMTGYYDSVISRKLASGEPIFFYFHPGDGRLDVIRSILERAGVSGLTRTTLLGYARWWRERHRIWQTTDIVFDGEGITVTCRGEASHEDIRAEIIERDGRLARIKLSQRIDIGTVVWRELPVPPAVPPDIAALTRERTRRLIEDLRTWFWRRKG